MDDEPRIPKLIGGANAAHSLPLAAVDGFVLSRIDGKATEKDLSGLTGLPIEQVRSSLEKLESLRVITLTRKDARPAMASPLPPPPPEPRPFGPKRTTSAGATPAVTSSSPASANPSAQAAAGTPEPPALPRRIRAAIAAIPHDAPELSEDVDLPGPLRLRILGASTALAQLDYYELLGIERTSDKKAVKRAYFELAALFHPDRYFRKRLGTFKLRMEALFGTVTQAHDTLSDRARREEYDVYLVDLDRTRGVEDVLRSAAEEAQRAEEDALRIAERTSSEAPSEGGGLSRSMPPDAMGAERKPSGFYSSVRSAHTTSAPPQANPPRAAPVSLPPSSSGSPVVTDQARRDALAMRLRGNRPLSRGASIPPPGIRVTDGGEGLKRRYEDRVALARRAQADKYVALAREAEAKNDVVGAAAAYRVALGFLPEADPMRVGAQACIAKADVALSETYLRQAVYEERSEHWPDAAKSWQRVVKGRPNDAHAHDRAAHTTTKAGGDLHAAADYARRAIEIDPQNADYRVTLATVLIEAGLTLNARRELEAAAQLSPRNATITALLKTVNKAG